jgi:hypothetical protein
MGNVVETVQSIVNIRNCSHDSKVREVYLGSSCNASSRSCNCWPHQIFNFFISKVRKHDIFVHNIRINTGISVIIFINIIVVIISNIVNIIITVTRPALVWYCSVA